MNLVDRGYFLLTMAHKLTVYFFHAVFCGLDWQIIMQKLNLATMCMSFPFYDCRHNLCSANLPSFLHLFFSSLTSRGSKVKV